MEKMCEVIKKEKPIMNILLMGATGVGKSSLINGLFGQEVAKAGVENLLLSTLKSMLMKKKA
ncbi:50S ribosome-binding GTPase [Helicobacter pylori]|uniref:GTPase n=1 Tax=Helicobacter pylori TaxID=210 RepID=UPI001FD4296E|nr:GTPase [Helicobacter pylori]UOR40001.1 50S ribosome-binding GTPase [Helicobacter pylori]